MRSAARLAFCLIVCGAACARPAANESTSPPREPADAAHHMVLRERSLGVMGTELDIKVFGHDAAKLDAAIDAAIVEIRRVEDMMTSWRASPLTRLNDAAGMGARSVPPELAALVAESVRLGELTGGAFDISFAGVGKLWDFKARPPRVPDAATIQSRLAVVDYRRIEVDVERSAISLPKGFRIGLGGHAKGYGVDRAMAVLQEHGVQHAFVNAGGDLKALGRKGGELWKIAIKHPRDKDRVLAVIPVSNTCVVTSGDYERFFEHEGRRYHHILDPRTGYPSRGCMAATVVGPSAAFCDGLATALCVLKPERGLALVNTLAGIEALLVGLDGAVHVSRGLQSSDKSSD